jgi:hypothetical protein
MQDLCDWAKKDPAIHAAALPIFWAGLENESEGFPATEALRFRHSADPRRLAVS